MTDNISSHKSRLIREYLESTGGDVVLTCLPPYAPQLNPIKIQWRMTRARLVCRYFAAEDEMERSIIRPVGSGEVQPVQISNLPIA